MGQWSEWKLQPCGTPAAYSRHRRRDGAPVTCQSCLQAEARRTTDRAAATGYNAARRERYAAARAAGLGWREARVAAGRSG